MKKFKISVITSCTAKKSVSVDNPLTFEDLVLLRRSKHKGKKLSFLPKLRAADMYSGLQHKLVMDALEKGKDIFDFDLHIISAGYGFLNQNGLIYPYEATFSNKSKKEITEMSEKLNLKKDVLRYLENLQTDMLFFLLGKNYFDAISLPSGLSLDFPIYVLTAKSVKNLPKSFIHIGLTQKHAKKYKSTMIALKGKLFLGFVNALMQIENFEIPESENTFLEFIDSYS